MFRYLAIETSEDLASDCSTRHRSRSPPSGGRPHERERSLERVGSRARKRSKSDVDYRRHDQSQDSQSEGVLDNDENSASEDSPNDESDVQDAKESTGRGKKGDTMTDVEAVVVNFCLKHKGALVPDDKCPACKACVQAEKSSELSGPVVPSARARFTRNLRCWCSRSPRWTSCTTSSLQGATRCPTTSRK